MFNNKTLLITGGTGTSRAAPGDFCRPISPRFACFRATKKQGRHAQAVCQPQVEVLYWRCPQRRAGCDARSGFCFHAAALKQVPSCEFFRLRRCTPTRWERRAFSRRQCSGVKRVVVLSTDKAVYPINAMVSQGHDGKARVAKSRVAAKSTTIWRRVTET